MKNGIWSIGIVITISVTAIIAIVGLAILSPFAKRCLTKTFPDACEALIVGTGTSLQMSVDL